MSAVYPPDSGFGGDILERRQFGAGQPHLRLTGAQPIEQGGAPYRIKVGGHFIKQQEPRPARCGKAGMGQRHGNQHGLLFAGGALRGRRTLADHHHVQFVAMRPCQGAPGGAVAAAARGKFCRQPLCIQRSARNIGQGGAGKGFVRQNGQFRAQLLDQPRAALRQTAMASATAKPIWPAPASSKPTARPKPKT